MPSGEAWWINTDGRVVSVYEHLDAVTQAPTRFGFKHLPPRATGESLDAYRERILSGTMQRGWIRVRAHRGHVSFEFWNLTSDVVDAVWQFIGDVLGVAVTIRMGEVSTGRVFATDTAAFFQDAERPRKNPGPSRDLYLLGRAHGLGRAA